MVVADVLACKRCSVSGALGRGVQRPYEAAPPVVKPAYPLRGAAMYGWLPYPDKGEGTTRGLLTG